MVSLTAQPDPTTLLLLAFLFPPVFIISPDCLSAFDAVSGTLEAVFYSEAQARSWAADRIAAGCVVVFSSEEE